MKRLLCLTALLAFSLGAQSQATVAYLGVIFGTDTYQLFLNSESGPYVVAYQWDVTGTLASGARVERHGVVERTPGDYPGTGRATGTGIDFGGLVTDVKIVVTDLAPVGVRVEREPGEK